MINPKIGLQLNSETFDVVIDKGCLDCLVCCPGSLEERKKNLELCLCEVARVMKRYFVCISCAIGEDKFVFFHVERRFGWKLVFATKVKGLDDKTSIFVTIYQKKHVLS
eukprot:TRINITY_DN7396_c0_g1_i3.p1 TRINITY_DN7396_c0_g1~~TRINITY_DN7396_c0_g1_i3.p1  ORF type:complete len:109 (-),score=24.38 TRINITY_DN7396_c0_g1_i3:99-425(-)